jgi:hypothetical protein
VRADDALMELEKALAAVRTLADQALRDEPPPWRMAWALAQLRGVAHGALSRTKPARERARKSRRRRREGPQVRRLVVR